MKLKTEDLAGTTSISILLIPMETIASPPWPKSGPHVHTQITPYKSREKGVIAIYSESRKIELAST